MTTVSDLKEGSIVYGYDLERKDLEIYQITNDNTHDGYEYGLNFYIVLGNKDNFYLNFPKGIDLDKGICAIYNSATYWLYSTNFEIIRKFMNKKKINIKKDFDKFLDIWSQKMIDDPEDVEKSNDYGVKLEF